MTVDGYELGVFIQWTGMDYCSTGMCHWTTGMDYCTNGLTK